MKLLLAILTVVMIGCAGGLTPEQRQALYLTGVGLQGFGRGMAQYHQYNPQPVQVYPQYNPMYAPVFNPAPIY